MVSFALQKLLTLTGSICLILLLLLLLYEASLKNIAMIYASWETCMQVRKQQLELDVEQQTGPK